MNITKAKGFVADAVRAYLATDDDGLPLIDPQLQRPLFLVGPPGIGKTAIVSQVASELGVGLVAYSMTHHTRQSALGLPEIVHREYRGYTYDASEYTMSEIIASVYDYMRDTGVEQGILFLDEINCVSETLYPSMLQFLQFKTFGKHAVPEGWVVACAGNPPEYNRSVHEFDVVTLDRLRRVEVEPDVDAWKAYAANAGVHPAVTTFLDTARDCFYLVESTPGGKRFVTARGWEDLSRMISVAEELDMCIDQDLIGQFVQDPDIAERFALYYDLFSKYRSDYQVPAILAGTAAPGIVERASAAPFDERLAVMGLLLDALTPRAEEIGERERVLMEARDVLRSAKEPVVAGGSAEEALRPEVVAREEELQRAGTQPMRDGGRLRRSRRVAALLKDALAACASAHELCGEEAFSIIHQEFRGYVGAFEADAAAFRTELDNAFAFLEQAFSGSGELSLFTTEVAARRALARFVSRYGSDAFARNNADLQVSAKRDDLLQRMEALEGAVGGEGGSEGGHAEAVGRSAKDGAVERAGTPGAGGEGAASGGAGESGAPAMRAASGASPSPGQLASYYEHARWEFGYASLCHMALPSGLAGKTVLDVGCRRGKGVFKLSERVGARGRAIGVDWVSDHIAEARGRMERAAADTGLPANNMEFHLAYPEDLMAAGIGDGTVDMAFVNSVVHLACEPTAALAEMHRVLKPGGLLVCEVALADGPRDPEVVRAARQLGNSVQAAPARADFEGVLDDLGFDVEVAEPPRAVAPDAGFKRGHEVPCAPGDEQVAFQALVLHAVKR